MIDYHIHTPRCRHAQGAPAEYLAEARRKGLSEIGFADHFPLALLGFTPRSEVTMRPEELVEYVSEVRELAAASPELTVKLGIEVDYLPGTAEMLAGHLARHPFDYVIGSIHFIDDWDFSHPAYTEEYQTRDLARAYRRYFELVWQACRSGLFDIIGHIDVINKFGFRPPVILEPYWRETAAVLKQTGTCLELNTAGRDAPLGRFHPEQPFLEICCRAGVPVTLGSDAHGPGQVGRYFDRAKDLLEAAGCRELSVFTGRRRKTVPIRNV